MFLGKRKIGVIGLGLIGSRIAGCLRKAGYSTYVWSRTPRAFPNFLGSIEALATQCPILQIFVSDDLALKSCTTSLVKCVGRKHIILNHATVSPDAAALAAEAIEQTGATFLNAPFTGSKQAAELAQLVYYVGGNASRLEDVRAILEATSKKILHVGTIREAAIIKIATNLISATTTQVLAEALALCRKLGVADETFAMALEWNGARSGVSDLKLPKMIQADFSPHFSVRHMLKDTGFGIDLAERAGIELPATSATTACLLARLMAGDGNLDFSALIKKLTPPTATHSPTSDQQPQTATISTETTPPANFSQTPVPQTPHETSTPPPSKQLADSPDPGEKEQEPPPLKLADLRPQPALVPLPAPSTHAAIFDEPGPLTIASPASKPELEHRPEAEVEPDVEFEFEPKQEPEPEPKPEPEIEHEPQTKREQDTESIPQSATIPSRKPPLVRRSGDVSSIFGGRGVFRPGR